MVASRQCKLKLSSEVILNDPVKAAYHVLFQLVTLGISTDSQMSVKMRQLLQASKLLCDPLDQAALNTVDRIFGLRIEETDLRPAFKEHKANVCELVKKKLVQL